jgi:hypothetical protein
MPAMTALTELEKDRQKRIEQNRKRMAEALGSMDQYALLMWVRPGARVQLHLAGRVYNGV